MVEIHSMIITTNTHHNKKELIRTKYEKLQHKKEKKYSLLVL